MSRTETGGLRTVQASGDVAGRCDGEGIQEALVIHSQLPLGHKTS